MESQIFELQYALDTFYFLVCGALVMWMAAGFAMLEAGLVRAKNTTEILTKNIALYAVACTAYMVCGYSIMYGGGDFTLFLSGIVGDGATGVEEPATYAPSADFYFQVVFVAATMSIVSGAVAERMKLWAFLVFAVIMTGVIYPLEGSWTWGGMPVFGMYTLGDLGFSDFAGSGIVHMAGASAALAGVLLLGARKGKYGKNGQIHAIPGANLPMATLGTFILWLGWFGFNPGSTTAANKDIAMIFVNTNLAAAAGAVLAMATSWIKFGKPEIGMSLNGALAGLVAITAPCASVTPLSAVIIGAAAGIIVVLSVLFFDKIKVDDPVGAISVHGVCGAWGTLAAGIFNIGGTSVKIIGVQLLGIGACFLWVFPAAFLMFKLIDKTVGLRVSAEEEMEGLDFAEHGGNAYPDFEVSSYGGVGSSSMGPGSPSATGDTIGQFKPVQQT